MQLILDDIAFVNIAWCPTHQNGYPAKMLRRCFSLHTGPTIRRLDPSVLILSGSQSKAFREEIKGACPRQVTIIETLHYAHREGSFAERQELLRVRSELSTVSRQVALNP
jgi:hypothetical protein